MGASAWGQAKVVAHRGYWNCKGSAQNSIAAIDSAYAAGAWGTEFDVHITADGVVVVNHDDDIHGTVIEEAQYADIKDMRLANGETLPTLKQYLEAGRRHEGLHLVLEIKEHATEEREDRCVSACLKAVAEAGMENRTDYISFSLHACEQLVQECPTARVYYLGGNLTPQECRTKRFAGIDYEGSVVLAHPEWIKECHDMGMTVNVWTIDEVRYLQLCKQGGVDYVTTNKPVEALRIMRGELKY